MMTQVLIWLYANLSRLYPRQFRAEFGDEMLSVFNEAIQDESGHKSMLLFLCELRALPGSLVEAYAADWLSRGGIPMNKDPISPSTRWQALLGTLPFLAFGVSSMIGKVDHIYNLRGHDAEMVVYSLALAGLLVGWIRGFPLWSYSYLGWSLLLAWANMDTKIHGVRWGYRIWIPFAVAVLIALLWTRSFQPIEKFFRETGKDWTRLSLPMYALGAWAAFMIYDENHPPRLWAFVLASTLVAACATWFFLRSSNMGGRALAVISGFIIAMIIDSISMATWDWRAYYGITKKPTTWYKEVWTRIQILSFWGIILLWPAIVELIRRKATRRIG